MQYTLDGVTYTGPVSTGVVYQAWKSSGVSIWAFQDSPLEEQLRWFAAAVAGWLTDRGRPTTLDDTLGWPMQQLVSAGNLLLSDLVGDLEPVLTPGGGAADNDPLPPGPG